VIAIPQVDGFVVIVCRFVFRILAGGTGSM
jgi:hypothetical protein